MSTPPHEIIIAKTEAEIQQCFDLRVQVFIHEQGFSLDDEFDDMDSTATHLLLRLTRSLTPIGTIRGYLSKDKTYYKLSRLVVLKEYRNYKFGRELVLALHDWVAVDGKKSASGQDAVEIVCHSQIPAKGFYTKLGYTSEGLEFDEDGAPHQKMVYKVALH